MAPTRLEGEKYLSPQVCKSVNMCDDKIALLIGKPIGSSFGLKLIDNCVGRETDNHYSKVFRVPKLMAAK